MKRMHVQVKEPELERFISEQVSAGHLPSDQAAVEAAIAQMKADHDEFVLTDADLVAIAESEEQIDRGDSVDFDTFAARARQAFG
jgi:Arc/MetJ-type ribon-helix-helix transcriptional regulator